MTRNLVSACLITVRTVSTESTGAADGLTETAALLKLQVYSVRILL